MTHQSNRQNSLRCPKCGDKDSLVRVRRHSLDRIFSRFVCVRRYECYSCGWEGLLRSTSSAKKKESH